MHPAPLAPLIFLRSPTHLSEPESARARGRETREGCTARMGPGCYAVEACSVSVAGTVAGVPVIYQRLAILITAAPRFARARIGENVGAIDPLYARARVSVALVMRIYILLIYIEKVLLRCLLHDATLLRSVALPFRVCGGNLLNIKGLAHG